MILLFHQNIAIMTPPKCATCSLHDALCTSPFNGHTAIGPSAPGLFDRHVTTWPSEAMTMRRFVVVRNPYSRLVSLYVHLARWRAANGFGAPDFGPFCRQVVDGTIEPFYTWTLSQWLAQAGNAEVLHVESLADDLRAVGLDVALSRTNASFYRKPWQGFFNESLIELVRPLIEQDLRWGYCDSQAIPAPVA